MGILGLSSVLADAQLRLHQPLLKALPLQSGPKDNTIYLSDGRMDPVGGKDGPVGLAQWTCWMAKWT